MDIVEKAEKSSKCVYIETFGCQMNEDDSVRMLERLRRNNYIPTEDAEKADLILVNTCSIRDKAEHKVYSTLGRYKLMKKDKPGLLIGVSGCVAQQSGEELLKRAPFLDVVVGTHNIHKIGDIVKGAETGIRAAYTDFKEGIDRDEYEVAEEAGVKAFVSIMRGCDNFCAYCIVPYVRGREASRSVSEIIDEVKQLSNKGTREVTLVGQNVNSYAGEKSFPELLRMVANVDGIKRVRFVTSHPKDMSDELIELFGKEEKLQRALHLPAQSGSNNVLKAMKRGYTIESYMAKVERLKTLYPDMALTTDIIAGFPGETDEDHAATIRLLKNVRFDNIFSFKYSPRPGTEAAAFDAQVDEDVKAIRLEEIQTLQRAISFEKSRALEGKTVKVLVEGESKVSADDLTGRSPCSRAVNFPKAKGIAAGDEVGVRIEKAYANSLRGAAVTVEAKDERGIVPCL
ncbi:MAG: tRNA (N6-isopentenyl adenosine(37)-C2)-methylthiotransferase MiaB [Deltaproteobacteria bacterium]|nr:tRNA (N6-isopentenyl adenosine(37)-C2)-methylthiotransferase MiaB [Deltaproteobacteria bacterium]